MATSLPVERLDFNDGTTVDCVRIEGNIVPIESVLRLARLFQHDEDAFSFAEDLMDAFLDRTVMQRMSA